MFNKICGASHPFYFLTGWNQGSVECTIHCTKTIKWIPLKWLIVFSGKVNVWLVRRKTKYKIYSKCLSVYIMCTLKKQFSTLVFEGKIGEKFYEPSIISLPFQRTALILIYDSLVFLCHEFWCSSCNLTTEKITTIFLFR